MALAAGELVPFERLSSVAFAPVSGLRAVMCGRNVSVAQITAIPGRLDNGQGDPKRALNGRPRMYKKRDEAVFGKAAGRDKAPILGRLSIRLDPYPSEKHRRVGANTPGPPAVRQMFGP